MITRLGWWAPIWMASAGWLLLAAPEADDNILSPREEVVSIAIDLQIGADGQDLQEPVALDLGLGFPLHLAPLGYTPGASLPYGAIPQKGSIARALKAGEKVTFEFTSSGESGHDLLRSSPQLLAGVQVSDISRVGFASAGKTDWVLAGYEVRVNGKILKGKSDAKMRVRQVQDKSRERITQIETDLVPKETEAADLQALIAASLATDADRTRLAALQLELTPLQNEKRSLDQQIRGLTPWFVDAEFQPEWRGKATIQDARVTVVTAPHTGAESGNYVYFHAGGHKFLLGAPGMPLTPDAGPQVFRLDLGAAPLVAGDLRGYGLGMYAHDLPYGTAPDRWHPQRLMVEIDGRVVYDSEENPLDRSSLAAVRVIPPTHKDAAGTIIENLPIARETSEWEAGKGIGLDLVNGGAESLPSTDDPSFPKVEPGLTIADEGAMLVDDGWYDPSAEPFPGEGDFGPDWVPDYGPPYPPMGPPWQPGWGPGWGPPWWQITLWGILHDLGIPPWVVPPPFGAPPQLETVNVDFTTLTASWTVTGNETQIDHFVVEVITVRPDLAMPFGAVVAGPTNVSASQRSISLLALPAVPIVLTADANSRTYHMVKVTMVPIDPMLGVDPGFSVIYPRTATLAPFALTLDPTCRYVPNAMPLVNIPISLGGMPALPGPTAWVDGQVDVHNGLVFANWSPSQQHLSARMVTNGDKMTVRFTGFGTGKYRLMAFIGFRGAVETITSADAEVHVKVSNPLFPFQSQLFAASCSITANPALAPPPLQTLIIDFDTAAIAPGQLNYKADYTLKGVTVDPAHPPMLVGVRLISMP